MINVSGACGKGAPLELVSTPFHVLLSLSFLSQCVEASTCPKCMGSDHAKFECALASLEPQQEPSRSRPMESTRQPGPARKRFRREVTPQPNDQNSTAARTSNICFSFNKGHTLNRATGSTNAYGVVETTR